MSTRTTTTRTAFTVGGANGNGTDTGLLTELRGLAIPYGIRADIGAFTEEFAPGAFHGSLRTASNLPLLAHHDPEQIVGVAETWTERSDGLWGQWRIGTSSFAQETARMVRDGLLNFLSIRFQATPENADVTVNPDGREHVRWRTARLIEVSLTPIPAYATATVAGIRHTDPAEDIDAFDQVFDLAVALSNPLVVDAITGEPRDMAVAAGMVRHAIARFGATTAAAELEQVAIAMHRAGRPMLAVNIERARHCIDPTLVTPRLAEAHIRRYLPPTPSTRTATETPPPPPPRRNRRRRAA